MANVTVILHQPINLRTAASLQQFATPQPKDTNTFHVRQLSQN